MCRKIRCDGKSWKILELNNAYISFAARHESSNCTAAESGSRINDVLYGKRIACLSAWLNDPAESVRHTPKLKPVRTRQWPKLITIFL